MIVGGVNAVLSSHTAQISTFYLRCLKLDRCKSYALRPIIGGSLFLHSPRPCLFLCAWTKFLENAVRYSDVCSKFAGSRKRTTAPKKERKARETSQETVTVAATRGYS